MQPRPPPGPSTIICRTPGPCCDTWRCTLTWVAVTLTLIGASLVLAAVAVWMLP